MYNLTAGELYSKEKEIETIKERTITLKLSDADCERIAKKAGIHNLSVGELLQNFIGDLVNGTYSNGSDERDRANDWFERCNFSWMHDKTLLRHLLEWETDIDDFLTICDELEYFKANPQEYEEEKKNGENLWFEDEYLYFTKKFLENNPDADMKKEIELCRTWYNDLQKMKEQ